MQKIVGASQYLFHKTAHLLRRALLHLTGSVRVSAQGKARVIVAKHVGHRFHVHAVLQSNGRERVPLRYNYDKPEKPRISRVSAFVVAYSIPFPTLIVNEKSVE